MKFRGGMCGLLAVVVLGGCGNLTGFQSGDQVIVSPSGDAADKNAGKEMIWLLAPTEQECEAAQKSKTENFMEFMKLVVEGRARMIAGSEPAVFLKQSGKYVQLQVNLPKLAGEGREPVTGYVLLETIQLKSAKP